MVEREVSIGGRLGLHARVAMQIVDQVVGAPPHNGVELVHSEKTVDASSIMQMVSLGAGSGTKVVIRAIGGDANRLVNEIEQILSNPDETLTL